MGIIVNWGKIKELPSFSQGKKSGKHGFFIFIIFSCSTSFFFLLFNYFYDLHKKKEYCSGIVKIGKKLFKIHFRDE